MIEVMTLKEAIDLWDEGLIGRGELNVLFLSLVTFENVDNLVNEIPEPLRTRFIDWVRRYYPKNAKAEDLVSIGGESIDPLPDCAIPAIQDWLERHPESNRT